MVFGFAAAFAGDWMLAVRCSPTGSSGFLAGVGCFALAHVLWMVAQLREARPDLRALVALGLPVVAFASIRLAPVLPSAVAAVVVAYSAVSAASISVAFGGSRLFYFSGISLLVFSDIAIGARILHVPGANLIVGPTYVLAEVLLLVSCFLRDEPRMAFSRNSSFSATAFFGAAAALSFVLAMHCFPGGYNPAMRMLSALGRTEVRLVEWPWSHYLFVVGMFFSALAVVSAARRAGLFPWGLALNVAGLLWIALVPEDVSQLLHDIGCWLAVAGGGVMLFMWRRDNRARSADCCNDTCTRSSCAEGRPVRAACDDPAENRDSLLRGVAALPVGKGCGASIAYRRRNPRPSLSPTASDSGICGLKAEMRVLQWFRGVCPRQVP